MVAAAVWSFGLFRFADAIPERVEDAATRTDGIVVLTGGSRRLGEGLELLSRGLAEKLFVSGVRSEEHTSELQSRRNLVCRLLLEKNNFASTNCP